MSERKPIGSAPTDGTLFLADDCELQLVCFIEDHVLFIIPFRYEPLQGMYQRYMPRKITKWTPTHWMPLPEPPEQE